MIGIGGAPTRETTLPDDPVERKKYPVASGFCDYFPDAVVAVSRVSWQGNEQHNPGQPLHWARGKSTDEADTMMRHFLKRGTLDTDGQRHSAKMAWRAMALLQKEIEAEQAPPTGFIVPGAREA
jgi:dATP/dGTP diphosphohydrolase